MNPYQIIGLIIYTFYCKCNIILDKLSPKPIFYLEKKILSCYIEHRKRESQRSGLPSTIKNLFYNSRHYCE